MPVRKLQYPVVRFRVEFEPSSAVRRHFGELLEDRAAGDSLAVHTNIERVMPLVDYRAELYGPDIESVNRRINRINFALAARAIYLALPAEGQPLTNGHLLTFETRPTSRLQSITDALERIPSQVEFDPDLRTKVRIGFSEAALKEDTDELIAARDQLLEVLANPGWHNLALTNPRLVGDELPYYEYYQETPSGLINENSV